MPTASSVTYKAFDVGLNWQFLKPKNNSDKFVLEYYSNLGIFNNVEIGFIGSGVKEGVFINLKYSTLLEDTSEYPFGLAAGFIRLSSFKETSLYLVISKQFPNKIGGHFGFNTNVLDGSIRANVMFGLELFISKYYTIIADIIGSEDSWNLSAGIRWKLTDDTLVIATVEDLFNNTIEEATLRVGISWSNLL